MDVRELRVRVVFRFMTSMDIATTVLPMTML